MSSVKSSPVASSTISQVITWVATLVAGGTFVPVLASFIAMKGGGFIPPQKRWGSLGGQVIRHYYIHYFYTGDQGG
jgi:hypothetical protein